MLAFLVSVIGYLTMKIQILVGVMVMGTPVFPTTVVTTGTGKNEKEEQLPTIIDVDKKVAKELVLAKQAKLADKKAAVNFEVKPLDKDDPEDDFGAFFEDEDDDKKEE